MASEQEYKQSASEKKKEDWMNSKWRPMMGWMYMVVCFMDFVGFPVLWSLLQMISHGNVSSQWQPLSLQGAGLFHIAMGAVIGISAYGRTQEKIGGVAGMGAGAGTTYIPPGQGSVSVNNSNQAPGAGGFGGSGFGGATTSTAGFGGGASAFGSSSPAGFGSTGGFSSPTPAAAGFGSSSGFGATTPGTSAFGAPLAGATSTGFGSANPAPSTPPSVQLATAPSLASRPVL